MQTRRQMLAHSATVAGLMAAAGLLPASAMAAWNGGAFEAKNMADLMKALGGSAPAESKEVSVIAPDIAENGAVVPVTASSTLPGIKRLLILIEKNPAILAAFIDLTDAVHASFQTRVKMGQSSDVFAVAMMNDGKVFFAKKEVKVTLGGCGG